MNTARRVLTHWRMGAVAALVMIFLLAVTGLITLRPAPAAAGVPSSPCHDRINSWIRSESATFTVNLGCHPDPVPVAPGAVVGFAAGDGASLVVSPRTACQWHDDVGPDAIVPNYWYDRDIGMALDVNTTTHIVTCWPI